MRPEREILVAPTATQLADGVVARLIATLVTAQRSHGLANLAVTGGSILEQVMRALAAHPSRGSVDWAQVAIWWGDERFVPADSADRNDLVALTVLLDSLALDPAHIHRMPASDGAFGDDVDAAARAYAAELAGAASSESASAADGVPRLDVILLGIGPDGHCASLFPEHPATRETQAAVIAVRDSPKPPPVRLTLGFRVLDSADEVWFVASGSGKADAVASAFADTGQLDLRRVEVPCAGPRGRYRTLWLVDQEAAANLPANLRQAPLV
ncbi:MAG TPA: 6-phosphogluconolactonase [Jatrophihabitantaceae bacterium]|jgi:6-phosphogluconolactonase|nr:6-phosphogluconolactonase [Jatrophihabitantaceae bacterium]